MGNSNHSLFLNSLKQNQVLIADGATGSNLQQRGLEKGEASESWVMQRPEKILELHREFIRNGSDIILTCTFGASYIRLQQHHLEDKFELINREAVDLAKKAADARGTFIAGSIGPLGQLLEPLGTLSETEALKLYAQQAKILTESGVDLLLIETQFDLKEASAAVEAARSVSSLPVVCSFSFDRGNRTMMGVKPEQFVQTIGAFGISMLGINCGRSLEENLNVLKSVRAATNLPIWFKPNAGLPSVDDQGNSIYSISPDDMGEQAKLWIEAGANVIGGCCGTSPAHLKAIASNVKKVD